MAGDNEFLGGNAGNVFDQVRIIGSAKADIVREDGRTKQVRMAMHGIDAPDDGDGDFNTFWIDRGVPISVRIREPRVHGRERFVTGRRAATTENGPKAIGLYFFGGHTVAVRLDDLTDFLLQSHLRHDLVNARFDHRVEIRHSDFGPKFWCCDEIVLSHERGLHGLCSYHGFVGIGIGRRMATRGNERHTSHAAEQRND